MQPGTASEPSHHHLMTVASSSSPDDVTKLQQLMQDQQQLALNLSHHHDSRQLAVATDSALFSPTSHQQQSREMMMTNGGGGQMSNSASSLLASTFLLDQRQQLSPERSGMASGVDTKSPVATATNPLADEQNGSNENEAEENGQQVHRPEEEGDKQEEEVQNGDDKPEEKANVNAAKAGRAAAENGPEEEQERRTSDLIRKQLAEIEKEITRRIQNKNVKQMDEQEMSQLLWDQVGGLAGLGAAGIDQLKSALPFSSSLADVSNQQPPSLNQLRHQNQPMAPLPPPLPSGFLAQPFPVHSQQQNQQHGHHVPDADQLVQPHFAAMAHQQPAFAFPAYSYPFLPQQQPCGTGSSSSQSPSPPMAQMLPPNLSAITPEMAASLLAQLQQQNPALFQSFVQQSQQQPLSPPSSSSAPNNKISSTLSTENGGCGTTAAESLPLKTPEGIPVALPAPPRAQSTVGAKRIGHQPSRRASISGGDKSTTTMAMTQNGKIAESNGLVEEQQSPLQQRKNSAEWAVEEANKTAAAMANGGRPAASNVEQQPVWVMRDSYLKRREREEQRRRAADEATIVGQSAEMTATGDLEEAADEEEETDRLLLEGRQPLQPPLPPTQRTGSTEESASAEDAGEPGRTASRKGSKKEVLIHEPAVLIEGVLFRARYLGSTQMSSDGRPTKSSRMAQAQEAVARVKAPEGEPQPSTEIDLFISTEKIMVLNTDLQRISDVDVRQDILMDHSLRSISYIADIGDLVVLMARRVPSQQEASDDCDAVRKAPRVICHVFESEESNFIAQSIGQAFQVAYVEFLRANGIEDPSYLRDIDYQEVLNSQEMMAEELELLARKETQKDVVVAKRAGEQLGVVIVESGWGSMLPTSVIANMAPGGAAARSNQLNIGDQIIGVNGISLVGLPLGAAQQNIKNARASTAVRLTLVSTPPVVEVRIRRPDTKYQLGFSVQNGVICSLLRGGIAERGGIRVGHRIIEINHQSVVAVPHERIVNMLATATGEIHMKTMPTSMFRLLTGQEVPNYI